MARKRIYSTPADRQRAYRMRVATGQGAPVRPPSRPGRPPSRPARLAALQNSLQVLTDEYQNWLDSLPDSLQDSGQGDRLRETIEHLQEAADLLDEIQLPRGFGRD